MPKSAWPAVLLWWYSTAVQQYSSRTKLPPFMRLAERGMSRCLVLLGACCLLGTVVPSYLVLLARASLIRRKPGMLCPDLF